jgi:hypothetical protein
VRIEESIQYIPMTPQLRVYSAGVWHNIVMSLFCVISLWSLPTLLSLGYHPISASSLHFPSHSGSLSDSDRRFAGGVVITQISSSSPLHSTLTVGDIITGINDVVVTSPSGFGQAISDLQTLTTTALISDDAALAIENRYMNYWSQLREVDGRVHDHNDDKVLRDVLVAPSGVCVSSMDVERLMVPELQCCRDVLLRHAATDSHSHAHQDAVNSCFMHFDQQKKHRMAPGHNPYHTTTATINTAGDGPLPMAAAVSVPADGDPSNTASTAALFCLPARSVMAPATASAGSGTLNSQLKNEVRVCEVDMDCHDSSFTTDSFTTDSSSSSSGTGRREGQGKQRQRCLRPLTPYPTSIIRLSVLQAGRTDVAYTSLIAMRREALEETNVYTTVDTGTVSGSFARGEYELNAGTPSAPAHTAPLALKPQHILFEGTADDLVSTVTVGEYMLQPWLVRVIGGVSSWFFGLLMMVPDTCALYLWLLLQVLLLTEPSLVMTLLTILPLIIVGM